MKRAVWPGVLTAMLALLFMAGSGWASTEIGTNPVITADTSPTPTPVRNFLPWLPNDLTPTPTPTPTATPIPPGWAAEYFNNTSLSGTPALTRTDSQVDFDWGTGSPGAGVQATGFSVRWTRTMTLTAGDYNLFTYTDDGVRLWIDDVLVIDEWQDQHPAQFVSARPIADGEHTIKMEYYNGAGRAVARLWIVNTTAYPQPRQWEWGAWKGEYFDNRDLSGDPKVVRKDSNLSFDWGANSPDPALPEDGFSARWTASLFLQAGSYNFFAYTDDGVRLYVDGALVIDQWKNQPPSIYRSSVPLNGGVHLIRMEYFEDAGDATAHLWWQNSSLYPQWRGEYFANTSLATSPIVIRPDSTIDFNWSGSPTEGVPHDGFSVRWTGILTLDAGNYTFTAYGDDGVRLWVDEFLGIDEWRDQSQQFTSVVPLSAGMHFIRMEYYQASYGAVARLTVTKS